MITAEQRERRRKHVGASDVAALFGLDPFKNAADVYWSKMGVDAPVNEAMMQGNFLEGGVLDWAAEQLDGEIHRDVEFGKDERVLSCNLDGLMTDGGRVVVEAKTSGIGNPYFDPEQYGWGDDWSDYVPDHIVLQVQTQMSVADCGSAYVAALLGGHGFHIYQIERADNIIEAITEKVDKFWIDHVLAESPPLVMPSPETMKAFKREKGSEIELPTSLVEELQAARATAKEAEARLDEAKEQILWAMGDAETGLNELGKTTFKVVNKKAYTVKASANRQLRHYAKKGTKDG